MDFTAFSHGQVHSKIWLCEVLEPYMTNNDNIAILGSWYNLLGFMLNVRKPSFYKDITGFDIDNVQNIADRIIDSWNHLPNQTVRNIKADVNQIELKNYNVVINTSVEHIAENTWFDNIADDTLVCIQSLNLGPEFKTYLINNQNTTLEDLLNKYQLKKIVYTGTKEFNYPDIQYKRFMIIGYK